MESPDSVRHQYFNQNEAKVAAKKSHKVIWELKQTRRGGAANLQISIQQTARPSKFSRPLTAITLNLNIDLPVDRRRISLLELPDVGFILRAMGCGSPLFSMMFQLRHITLSKGIGFPIFPKSHSC